MQTEVHIPSRGESLPPCCGVLWSRYYLAIMFCGTLHTGDDSDVTFVPSGSAKSRAHKFAVGGFLGNSKGMVWRMRAYRLWTFMNFV